jgi:hypothetical protein
MRSSIAKHWAGKSGNSPLKQYKSPLKKKGDPVKDSIPTVKEPKFTLDMNVDKNEKSVNSSLNYNNNRLNTTVSGGYKPNGSNINLEASYSNKKRNITFGGGVSKVEGSKPNVTGRATLRF